MELPGNMDGSLSDGFKMEYKDFFFTRLLLGVVFMCLKSILYHKYECLIYLKITLSICCKLSLWNILGWKGRIITLKERNYFFELYTFFLSQLFLNLSCKV